jgi:hypothetical protein
MSETVSRKKLVCLHITKTAGGTLKRALKATPLNVEFVYGKADKDALLAKDLSKVDILYGHMPYGVHTKVGYDYSPRYMCFMRHPTARTISHYFHLRNVDRSPVGDRIRQSDDINDFFKTCDHWEFRNFMTGSISGLGPNIMNKEQDALDLAKKNMDETFDFIGFQEYFSFSMRKLSTILNADLQVERDVNVGRYDLSQVSDRTLGIIEEYTKLDFQLYKYALQKFL